MGNRQKLLTRGLAALLGVGVFWTAPARAAGTAPEEPHWQAGESPMPSPGEVPANDEPARATEVSAPEANPASPAPTPFPTDGMFSDAEAAAESGLDDEDSLGVPAPVGDFLPSFEYQGKGWFERDGLKFRFGPMNLRFALGVGLEYNDNIFGTSVDPVADAIATVYPTILLGAGDFQRGEDDYLSLNYSPAFNYYYEQKERNQVNQNLAIAGQATFSRFSTKLAVSYTSSDQPNATQSGGQNYTNFSFASENRYFLTNKVFAQATVNALIQSSENESNDSQTFSLAPQMGYQLSPKTTVFAGPYAGIAFVGEGGTQTFQGLSVTLQYDTLRKLAFDGTVGVQGRQYQGINAVGAKNFITPVFNFGVTWKAREKTTVNLELARDVGISDLAQGLTYTSTGFSGGIQQRIWVLGFNLSGGYQLLEYQGDEPFGRTENFLYANASLDYRFWRDAFTISIYYRRQNRTSDVSTSDYLQNVYGVRFNYSF